MSNLILPHKYWMGSIYFLYFFSKFPFLIEKFLFALTGSSMNPALISFEFSVFEWHFLAFLFGGSQTGRWIQILLRLFGKRSKQDFTLHDQLRRTVVKRMTLERRALWTWDSFRKYGRKTTLQDVASFKVKLSPTPLVANIGTLKDKLDPNQLTDSSR